MEACPPGPARARITSAVSLRSKSAHAGTIAEGASDHTTRTRSSRYSEYDVVSVKVGKRGRCWEMRLIKEQTRTINAARCSLSARGSRDMVSNIWMRVSASTGSAVAVGGLWRRVRIKENVERRGRTGYLHTTQRSMHCGAPHLHGHDWVQGTHGSLKGGEGRVIVWKDTIFESRLGHNMWCSRGRG